MENHERGTLGIIFRRLIGFVVLIIFLIVANILVKYVNNSVYTNVIGFFNSVIALFVILLFIGTINEILWSLDFPFNLIAPVTSAILSIFIVEFFYKLWGLIEFYAQTNAALPMAIIYPFVFIVVLVLGYLSLLARGKRTSEEWREHMKKEKSELKREVKSIKPGKERHRGKNKVTWEDVGEEFKFALFNLGVSINKALERHRERKRKK